MDHPTFADNAFAAFLDRRLRERFPEPADVVGEDVPRSIAENFRVWLADPATRATHHPVELRELEKIADDVFRSTRNPPAATNK